jgi:hypothetical protein
VDLENLPCADDRGPVDRDLGAGERKPGEETRSVVATETPVPPDLQGGAAALPFLQVRDVLDGRVQPEGESAGSVLARRTVLVPTGKLSLAILEGI